MRRFLGTLAVTVALQGAQAALHAIASRTLTVEEFGVVRSTDGLVSIVLIIAAGGGATLASRYGGLLRDPTDRLSAMKVLLLRVVPNALLAWFASLLAVAFLGQAVYWPLLGIVPISAFARVLVGFLIGGGDSRRIAVSIALTTFGSLVLALYALSSLHLVGWVCVRYLIEVAVLASAAVALRELWRAPSLPGRRYEAQSGWPITASLLVRTVIDNVPTLYLARTRDAHDLGIAGFAVFFVTLALILNGVASANELGRLAGYSENLVAFRAHAVRAMVIQQALAVCAAIGAATMARPLITWLVPSYESAVPLIHVLALWIPARAAITAGGAAYTALGDTRTPLVLNLLHLPLVAGWLLLPHGRGMELFFAGLTLLEWLIAVAYIVPMWRRLRGHSSPNATGGFLTTITDAFCSHRDVRASK